MKNIYLILFLFISNGIFSQEFGTLIAEGKRGNIVYKIYSQREQYINYVAEMKKDSTNGFLLWEKYLYNPSKSYLNLEFSESTKEIGVQKKNYYKFQTKILNQESILDSTLSFEKNIEKILLKTLDYYHSEKDTLNILLMPMAGQGGTVKPFGNRKSVMPIGVNKVEKTSNLPIIIPHEYTHRINQLSNGIPEEYEIWLNKSKMYWSLWSEGLAIYGTGAITNNFSLSNVMFFKEYKDFPDNTNELDRWLAIEFLKVYNDPLLNFDDDEKRAMWFASNSTALRKDLPPAIGYYLGYKVVKYSIDHLGYTFEELLGLKPNKLKRIGKKALKKIKEN